MEELNDHHCCQMIHWRARKFLRLMATLVKFRILFWSKKGWKNWKRTNHYRQILNNRKHLMIKKRKEKEEKRIWNGFYIRLLLVAIYQKGLQKCTKSCKMHHLKLRFCFFADRFCIVHINRTAWSQWPRCESSILLESCWPSKMFVWRN